MKKRRIWDFIFTSRKILELLLGIYDASYSKLFGLRFNFNFSILPNDDVINPDGQNWFSIKFRIALSQVGDWVEYDHVSEAAESIRSLDGTSCFTYLEGAGFYGLSGSEGGREVMFATGDKFKLFG